MLSGASSLVYTIAQSNLGRIRRQMMMMMIVFFRRNVWEAGHFSIWAPLLFKCLTGSVRLSYQIIIHNRWTLSDRVATVILQLVGHVSALYVASVLFFHAGMYRRTFWWGKKIYFQLKSFDWKKRPFLETSFFIKNPITVWKGKCKEFLLNVVGNDGLWM